GLLRLYPGGEVSFSPDLEWQDNKNQLKLKKPMSQNSFFICIYQPRYSIQNTFSFPKSMQNFCPHAFKSKNRAKVLGINRNMKTGMIFLNKQKAKGKGQKAK